MDHELIHALIINELEDMHDHSDNDEDKAAIERVLKLLGYEG